MTRRRQLHAGRWQGSSDNPQASIVVDRAQETTDRLRLDDGGVVGDLGGDERSGEVGSGVAFRATGCDSVAKNAAGGGPRAAGGFVFAACLDLAEREQ